jgi:hypothetical protein
MALITSRIGQITLAEPALPSAAQAQQRNTIRVGFQRQHLMALLGGRPWHVAQGFLAPQLHQQHGAGRHAVERKPGPDEGHRTDFVTDVQDLIGRLRFCHDTTRFPIWPNNHCETAGRIRILLQSSAGKGLQWPSIRQTPLCLD